MAAVTFQLVYLEVSAFMPMLVSDPPNRNDGHSCNLGVLCGTIANLR